jgi:hypothetical protein
MTGRRAVLGLSLLCALLSCALAAQGASAAPAKNTTAFTCVKGGGAKDFKDAHCDEKVTPETGEYGHVVAPLNETTKVIVTNEKTKNGTTESTPAVLKGELGGAKLEISCTKVSGEGTLTNEEPEAKTHGGKGSGATQFSSCTVLKPSKCTIKPVEVSATGEGLEELGAGKNEMGGELRPPSGKIFVTITLEGESCALKGKPLEVEGTAIATSTPAPTAVHTGTTAILTNAMTKETLKIGGKPAEISASTTVRRAPVEGKEQNPISSTTVT